MLICTNTGFVFLDKFFSIDYRILILYIVLVFIEHKINYYSFKIFPRFGLVETTRIIHHNRLLLTKFGKNLRHIQSMTSKEEPAANYSTVDVKMTSKVEPAAEYSTVDRKNLGTRLWFWWAEKQRAKRRNYITNGEIFWMNNKSIIEFSFRRIWRILQISESVIHLGRRPRWITPSLICRILHILRKPNSIIAKYSWSKFCVLLLAYV